MVYDSIFNQLPLEISKILLRTKLMVAKEGINLIENKMNGINCSISLTVYVFRYFKAAKPLICVLKTLSLV